MTGCSALVSDARALMFLNRCSRSCMPRAISPAACVFASRPPPGCSALVANGDKTCFHALTRGRPELSVAGSRSRRPSDSWSGSHVLGGKMSQGRLSPAAVDAAAGAWAVETAEYLLSRTLGTCANTRGLLGEATLSFPPRTCELCRLRRGSCSLRAQGHPAPQCCGSRG